MLIFFFLFHSEYISWEVCNVKQRDLGKSIVLEQALMNMQILHNPSRVGKGVSERKGSSKDDMATHLEKLSNRYPK